MKTPLNNKPYVVRSIRGLSIKKINKQQQKKLSKFDEHEGLFSFSIDRNSKIETSILYKISENEFLELDPNFIKEIGLGDVGNKSWYTQINSFLSDDREIFSASLLIDGKNKANTPFCSDSDDFVIGMQITQENFELGSDLRDFYSGCISKDPLILAPAGILQHFDLDVRRRESPDAILEEISINKEFDKNEYKEFFSRIFGSNKKVELEILHDVGYPVGSVQKKVTYYRDLDQMVSDGKTGEVLIKKMHTIKTFDFIFPPRRYKMTSDADQDIEISIDDYKIAIALQKFAETKGLEASFGIFDDQNNVVKVNLVAKEDKFYVEKKQVLEDAKPENIENGVNTTNTASSATLSNNVETENNIFIKPVIGGLVGGGLALGGALVTSAVGVGIVARLPVVATAVVSGVLLGAVAGAVAENLINNSTKQK
jgi:hypothetical protein